MYRSCVNLTPTAAEEVCAAGVNWLADGGNSTGSWWRTGAAAIVGRARAR